MKKKISGWIRKQVKASGAKGIVLGLSGGVDSSVVAGLAKEAVGKSRVLGLFLPCHSQKKDLEDAKIIAAKLGIRTVKVDLGHVYDNLIKILPQAGMIPKANLKPRLRMLVLYYFANKLNYLVAGTGNKSECSVGYFCYDENTRAVTKEGLKTYKELKPKDIVFSLDPNTGHVVECPVKETYVFDYNGKMMSCGGRKNSRFDLMVTPNHRMLVDKGRLHFCRADLLLRRPTPTPIPKLWQGIKVPPTFFNFDNNGMGINARYFSPMPIEDFLYILGLYIGDGHAQLSSVKQLVKEIGNEVRKRDAKTGKFIYKDIRPELTEYAGYRTWIALPQNSSARSKLIAILKRNNIIYGETSTQVWICGKPFYQAMRQCGSSAHTKCIPPEILDYAARYLAILLEGLMDSDGSLRGRYYTVSNKLAEQMLELGCKLGKNISLTTRPPRTATRRDGVKINSTASYEVAIYGNGRHWLNGAKFRRVDYSGKVWCPDVPGTHNFLVERNGRFIFCGNTKHGDGATDILPIADLLKREVRKLARELKVPEHIITKPPTAGLWPGQTDEGEMGITYAELDEILARLGCGKKQISPAPKVDKVKEMMRRSRHKREGVKICLI